MHGISFVRSVRCILAFAFRMKCERWIFDVRQKCECIVWTVWCRLWSEFNKTARLFVQQRLHEHSFVMNAMKCTLFYPIDNLRCTGESDFVRCALDSVKWIGVDRYRLRFAENSSRENDNMWMVGGWGWFAGAAATKARAMNISYHSMRSLSDETYLVFNRPEFFICSIGVQCVVLVHPMNQTAYHLLVHATADRYTKWQLLSRIYLPRKLIKLISPTTDRRRRWRWCLFVILRILLDRFLLRTFILHSAHSAFGARRPTMPAVDKIDDCVCLICTHYYIIFTIEYWMLWWCQQYGCVLSRFAFDTRHWAVVCVIV